MNAVAEVIPAPLLKIDLGCGPNPLDGYEGADSIKFDKVKHVLNIGKDRWPWDDNSVDEAYCSHTIEHLTNFNGQWERVHFFNELHRVLKPDAGCLLIFPHWASARYYGDPTHKEPISEWFHLYLMRDWRMANAPHTDKQHNQNGYDCNFQSVIVNVHHQQLGTRNSDYQQYACAWYKEAILHLRCTVIKRA
jgi:SAM-dependent methyltransferase